MKKDRNHEAELENNVHILCFPAHSTHFTQPLDVSVFKPMKRIWSEVLNAHNRRSSFKQIDKSSFTKLMKRVSEKGCNNENAIAGFKKTGIHSFDSNVVDPKKLKIADILSSNSNEN